MESIKEGLGWQPDFDRLWNVRPANVLHLSHCDLTDSCQTNYYTLLIRSPSASGSSAANYALLTGES